MQGDFNQRDTSTGIEETGNEPDGIINHEIEVDEELEEDGDLDNDEEEDEEDDLNDEFEIDDDDTVPVVLEPMQALAPAAVVSPWNCSICAEPSRAICLYCTKDTCDNHLCPRCGRCSDCCACDLSRAV